jgi:hypothetical protein
MASPACVHTARATVRTNVRSDRPRTTRRRAELTCGSITATNSGTACDDNTHHDGDARGGRAAIDDADASAMPSIIRGHTYAPSVLIGEKAAELICA